MDQKGFAPLYIIILVLVLVGLTVGVFYFSRAQNQNQLSNYSQTPKKAEKSASGELKTASFYANNLADKETIIHYADANILYQYKLDGGLPQKVTEFEDDINSVETVPFSTDLYLQTLKKGPDKTTNIGEEWKGWLLKEGSKEPELLYDHKITSGAVSDPHPITKKLKLTTVKEFIYPEKAGTGVNIMLDPLDGTKPQKIGFLGEPLIKLPTEYGNDPKQLIYPYGFIPSYSGEYLLNEPPGGGGLGQPGVVVSRDGTKIYSIDFYWYVSDAIWISGNQLLASDQKGQKLFTFKPDGTFTTDDAPYIKGEFSQHLVSPSKEYVVLNDVATPKLELLNLKNKSTILIDSLDKNALTNEYKVPTGEVITTNLSVLSWNKSSDKILYSVFIGSHNSDPNRTDPAYKKEIKVFDLKTKKSYKISDLKIDNNMWLGLRLFAFQ